MEQYISSESVKRWSVSRVNPRTLSLALALVLMAVTFSSAAFADRIKWKRTAIDESSEAWKVDMEFHLGRAPDIAHVPMRFEFENTVYYERSLVDGKEKPIIRRVPLQNKAPLIESVDVGFLDPGSGKTQKRTRFSFKLTRDRGYEAGEYKVTVTNKRSGKKLGGAVTLKLNGENEVIDRRAMDFSEKKQKKEEAKKEEEPQAEPDPSNDPKSEEYWASGPAEPEATESDLPPPAHLQEKPGACGCRTVGNSGTSLPASLLLLIGAIALPVARRRRC